MDNTVKAGIFGVCVGDALGVPVEFTSREILKRFPEDSISLGGYVVHSLEASLWCFLNSENYSEAV
ncbi:ADP-ribosylglycohydrolase family protein [Chryseobacterium nepalense]|uniref:ADP-ribosylglycohydrolase family protein n=1 Tax=Chryseobacterium nepalense TaxID=1854498 RepID=UPI002E005AFC|nr:ADP-ribosylglycohydrolase [Chryseobacterium nepalense]